MARTWRISELRASWRQFSGAPVVAALLLLFLACGAYAQDACSPPLGRIVSVQGTAEVRRPGTDWKTATLDATLCSGDTLRVGLRSRAALRLSNETTLRLDQGTTLTFAPPDAKGGTIIEQIGGGLNVITRTPRPFRVKTPFVNANVEGTEFAIRVGTDLAVVEVFEGQVKADNEVGSVTLVSGERAVATANEAPRKEIVVRSRTAVTWTLHFPTLFDYALPPPGTGRSAAELARQESAAAYRAGDVAAAIEAIRRIPAAEADSGLLAYRAGLLLLVGRLDEAQPEIELALQRDPGNADAHALQAVIAIARNDKSGAQAAAERAVAVKPTAPVGHIALSYARQAAFDIEGARASALEAVTLDPNHALGWSRLAEMELSLGRLAEAEAAARTAATLSPRLSRAQTILGFARLTRTDISGAEAAFNAAIPLDQGDPLPRLGLGLAKIRGGDLAGGREQIEIAASLGPGDSLIRSYLGKAYFDERRDLSAKTQYEIAKELDPNDPTPWFYDAVRSQASNELAEALASIQASIEKNDNRAVFRSKLLLDDDLAARSIGQASIYRQLGFEQLALFEAYKALSADPLNFSGHRFLAEAYAERPRHQFARENEALQAQMLQPISLYPLQLPLTATEAGAFGTSVLFDPGFSEYNRLYVRNGVNGQLLGLVGGRDTWADQVLVTGVNDRLSYSFGQFHYESDGFRSNANVQKDLYDVFVQFTPTDGSSLHFEWRKVRLKEGDLSLRFDPDFTTDLRYAQDKEMARLGARHRLSDRTLVLASLATQKSSDTTDSEMFGGRLFSSERKDNLAEVQVAHRFDKILLRAGGGYLRGRETTDVQSTVDEHKQRSYNAYVYASTATLPGGLRLEGGVSHDYVDDPGLTRTIKQTNYKAGLGWNVTPDTTVRLATFRVLKRTGLAEMTLEPTQVMGFNQFFDDFNGTSSRRSAIALDHKISTKAFTGIEFTRRDLKVPQGFSDPLAFFDWQERSHTAYVSVLPAPWIAVNAAFRYEDIRRVPEFSGLDDLIRARTQRMPVTISLITSPESSVRLRITPVRQSGTFLHPDFSPFEGESSFTVVDATATYHLPKRYGTITAGVQNLFDKRAPFQETDISAPTLTPRRFVFARLSLAF